VLEPADAREAVLTEAKGLLDAIPAKKAAKDEAAKKRPAAKQRSGSTAKAPRRKARAAA
jgi:hypothetical protein